LILSSTLLYDLLMPDIYRRQHTNFRNSLADEPDERFEVRGGSPRGERVGLDDITFVVGALVADLAQVIPPLPDGYADDVKVETSFGPEHPNPFYVTALYRRTDASTLNAETLGYATDGWLPNPALITRASAES
jgi:hypothetical protein